MARSSRRHELQPKPKVLATEKSNSRWPQARVLESHHSPGGPGQVTWLHEPWLHELKYAHYSSKPPPHRPSTPELDGA